MELKKFMSIIKKDMKDIMAYVNPLVKGKADMGLVNKIIKEKLNNL